MNILGWLLSPGGDGLSRLEADSFDYLDNDNLLKTAARMERKAESAKTKQDKADYTLSARAYRRVYELRIQARRRT